MGTINRLVYTKEIVINYRKHNPDFLHVLLHVIFSVQLFVYLFVVCLIIYAIICNVLPHVDDCISLLNNSNAAELVLGFAYHC